MITIGKLSKIFGISTRTIRHYEDIGLLECSTNSNGNNYRQYDDKEIKELEKILIFKSLGFSLNEIKVILGDVETKTIRKIFDEKLDNLEIQISKLMQNKDMVLSAKNLITLQGLEYLDKEQLIKELVSMKNLFIRTFSSLNAELQSKILLELYRTGSLSVDTIKQIGTSDSTQLLSELHMMTVKAILSKVDRSTEKNIMLRLGQENPEFADRLKMALFTFEDIIILPDTVIEKWLRKCNDQKLAIALSSSGNYVQKRIFNNMSKERRDDLKNIIRDEKLCSLDETYKAMTDLVEILMQMDMSGEVEIDSI